MEFLTSLYWVCFGVGLLYVLIAGTLGAVSAGMEAAGDAGDFDTGFDTDLDTDFDVDVDTDVDFDVDVDADLDVDLDHDAGLDFGHGEVGHDIGHDIGHDVAHAHAGDAGFSGDVMTRYNPFSPLSIMATICGFGGGGLIAMASGMNALVSVGPALGGGIAMALLFWLLIGKLLFSIQGSSHARQSDMIGLEAEVLTPVEHDMSGEIAYILDGTRFTAPARLVKEGKVGKRETVRIREMRGNMVYVEEKRKLLE